MTAFEHGFYDTLTKLAFFKMRQDMSREGREQIEQQMQQGGGMPQ